MGRKSEAYKARRREKQRIEAEAYDARVAVLRAQGASCGTCRHMRESFAARGTICDLDSDFHGYCPVRPDHLCDRWEAG